jgi:hypothetical protein
MPVSAFTAAIIGLLAIGVSIGRARGVAAAIYATITLIGVGVLVTVAWLGVAVGRDRGARVIVVRLAVGLATQGGSEGIAQNAAHEGRAYAAALNAAARVPAIPSSITPAVAAKVLGRGGRRRAEGRAEESDYRRT